MTKRDLDGFYLRVQRNGKWESCCFTDLTEKEQHDWLERLFGAGLQSMVSSFCENIVKMLLSTMSGTADLMLEKDMSFEEVVSRVATRGGITEEGTKVIYDLFPPTAEQLFNNTLEKRRRTAEKAKESFE